ncbi:SusD/RagB family nutrient-binding outer membrane lipoprotein [Pedobacter gandavensis]|uniref:SusD/RagB family nutrient-binding outer membrane lipoprotein n=1 Tax=Pedobacter gandavensis TaxID=2679963 RepID=UPI00247A30E9|nr:SusD/RagB family nutrient-binding outer membrane lipoprotein [Pedobacter gandavensis]WGQ08656.1 SusD/RagB family nutrient-binding outer membrane lipoprotein [Pedobacter gandavensis]
MKKSIKIFVFAAGLLSLTSCEKFLDVNDNPNGPTEQYLILSARLPGALVSTINQETVQINQLAAFWAGYWGTTSEATNKFYKEKTYNGVAIRGTRDGIQIWEGTYNTLLYYQLIKEQALKENAPFYSGIAKIMQGWHFLHLVDMYNNVPFDEALNRTLYLQPKYEDGKTVYEKSVSLITEGMAEIKGAAADQSPGKADIIFSGDKQLWAKFGNTLKLRALIRQSQTNNDAYITAEIDKIKMEGSGFLGLGQNAATKPGYINSKGKMNPFWETNYRGVNASATNHVDLRPTQYIIDKYRGLNDPRLASLYVSIGGTFKGVLFGNPNVDAQYAAKSTSAFKGPTENDGKPTGLFKSFDQALILMGSFESLFLQAEAANRGWIAGSDQTFYEQGIAESFKYMEVAAAEFTAYNAQPTVKLSGAAPADRLKRIIEQKWLALNSISSLEAWSDYRRLGFPEIPNSLLAPSPTARPLRLMYPESERQTNAVESGKQGNDEVTVGKIWWNK